MNQHIIFDRTRYTDKLRDNGVDEKTARAHSDALDGALRDAVATKTDLSVVEQALKSDIAEFRTEFKTEVTELRTEIAEVKSELKADIAELKTEMTKYEGRIDNQFANINLKFADVNTKFADQNAKAEAAKLELLRWMIGTQLALAGLITGLLLKLLK
jgi:chromosome segregation ATPase